MTNTFEIRIQRLPKGGNRRYPVVVTHTRPEDLRRIRTEGGEFYFNDKVRQQLLTLGLQPRKYGLKLGELLFSGVVYEAFVEARGRSQSQAANDQDILHVFLGVEPPELRTLRWERLCAPLDTDYWNHLARDQRFPFAIDLASSTGRYFLPIGRHQLHALVLVANPAGLEGYQLTNFDAPTAVTDIQTALKMGNIRSDILAANIPEAVGKPTFSALLARLTSQRYSLLHIVAHGRFIKNGEDRGETLLYLANENNEVEPIRATNLIEELKGIRGIGGLPCFTFLVACESGTAEAEAEGGLGGLAQRLVRELGMSAVVAMTDKVTISTALKLTPGFYKQLQTHGEVDRALVEAAAGLRGADRTVPALYSSLAGHPLFSIDTSSAPLNHDSIKNGLTRLIPLLDDDPPNTPPDLIKRPGRAPILVDKLTELTKILAIDREDLSKPAKQSWDKTLAEINTICENVIEINFRALALGQDPLPYDGRCPFPGLVAFQAKDKAFFFGRESVVAALRQHLSTHPFLAVLGDSGSGKSSLVLADLIPSMKGHLLYMTPGNEPLSKLNKTLPEKGDADTQRIAAILVVDQFEEFFTLCKDDEQRHEFLARLWQLIEDQAPLGLKVVITMRLDFFSNCAQYPTLAKMIQAHKELILPLSTDELRSAMERQAGAVGLRFEEDWSDTILADVQDERGAMPLLQLLAREMWKRRHGRWLRTDDYHKLGGIKQVIARVADELYENFSEGEQRVVSLHSVDQSGMGQIHLQRPGTSIPYRETIEQRLLLNIFRRLTHLGNEGGRDTRRRATMEELIPNGQKAELTKTLINQLAARRLVVTSGKQISNNSETVNDDQSEVNVAHEALISYWPRLRTWLNENRPKFLLLQQISREALEWEKSNRDKSYLREGKRLEEIENLSEQPQLQLDEMLNEIETAYVNACIAPLQRRKLEGRYQRFVEQFFDLEIHILELQDQHYPVEFTLRGIYEPFRGYLDRSIVEWGMNSSSVEVGKRLFEHLFANEQLKTVWARVREQQPQRRIHIHIDALASELHVIPWESLCDIDASQQSPQTLATDVKTPFSRYLTSQLPSVAPIIDRPLKLLIAISNPYNLERYGLTRLDSVREKEIIQEALSGLETQLELTFMDEPVTLSALEEQLKQGYHMLHLLTHARFSERQGSGVLFLADKLNQISLIKEKEFAAMLSRQRQKPQLILLTSGEVAGQPAADALHTYAPYLIDAGVPAVLAIQAGVPVKNVQDFLRIFYQKLLLHGLVDLATNEARSALMAEFFSVHGMPILSSCIHNNQLFGFNERDIGEELKKWPVEEQRRIQEQRKVTAQQLFVSQFTDLDIRILEWRSEGYPIEIILNRASPFVRGYLDPAFPMLPWLRTNEDGEQLFKWLFADETLKTAWAMIQWRYPKRRIRLHLASSTPELHALPWELLRQVESPFFRSQTLATDTATPFSRYLPGQWSLVEPIHKSPIKLLVAIANPDNLDQYGLIYIDVEREKQLIQEALSGLETQLELTFMDEPVTLSALEEQLKQGYHMLHLLTHAHFSERQGSGVLFLADKDNQVRLIDRFEFITIVKQQAKIPHLIFLAGVQTAMVSPADAFSGFAPALFNAGVPAVLGMRDLGAITMVHEFTRVFYQRLLSHGLADLACNEARATLLAQNLPGSDIPVLFSRLRDNLLFDFGASDVQSVVSEKTGSVFEPPSIESIIHDLRPVDTPTEKEPQLSSALSLTKPNEVKSETTPKVAEKPKEREELLYFNGINGETGEYWLPPMTSEEFFHFVRSAGKPENLAELKLRYESTRVQHL